MNRQAYDTDLSDIDWELLVALIPPEKRGGRHRSVEIREVLNAIFYVLRSGCAWRLVPLLPGVADRLWLLQPLAQVWPLGAIEHRPARGRPRTGRRAAAPTAAIIDSQSVKTSAVAGQRGYDGANW